MAYSVIKLTDRIWSFEEEGVRSFLVVGDENALQIDTGYGEVNFTAEIPKITTLPVMLVNTHHDVDHTGGNSEFSDCACYAHPDEIQAIETDSVHCLPCPEGFEFDLGGITLEVIHLPGHTPGSIGLLDREDGILFSGDMVSLGTIWMFGDDRNMKKFVASQKKLASISGIKKIFPCHGELPVEPGSIFSELAELGQSVIDGTAEYTSETLGWGDVSFDVKLNRSGRVSMYTF